MSPIFLISGTPASGKSSVSLALMRRFARGVHLAVDDLREMVISGIAHPVPEWTFCVQLLLQFVTLEIGVLVLFP